MRDRHARPGMRARALRPAQRASQEHIGRRIRRSIHEGQDRAWLSQSSFFTPAHESTTKNATTKSRRHEARTKNVPKGFLRGFVSSWQQNVATTKDAEVCVLGSSLSLLRRARRGCAAGERLVMRRASLTIVLVLATACATNPVTGKRELSLMSEAQEIQIGQSQDAEVR